MPPFCEKHKIYHVANPKTGRWIGSFCPKCEPEAMTPPNSAMDAALEINGLERRGFEGRNLPPTSVAEIIDRHQSKEREELLGAFQKLAADMREHSEKHMHDYNQLAAAVEGVCADRIESLLSRYRKD